MPGVGGTIALPSVASQITGKYLCFLVTKATDRKHVKCEFLVQTLTRLKNFIVKSGETTLFLPFQVPIGEKYILESYML